MNSMDDLKRNGSGYYDPTAYKAMKNFENGGGSNMKRGEIWKIGFGRDEKLAVVLTVQDTFCNVLVLNEQSKNDNDVAIKAIGLKYTNPAMMSYAFKDNFREFVRLMRDEEKENLFLEIAKRIDFPASVQDEIYFENLVADKNEELEALKAELEKAKTRILNLQTEPFVVDAREFEDNIVVKTERDLYKKQYELLLERLIGA